MKKTILIVALFIGLLITSAGFNKTSLNTTIGKIAPSLASDTIDSTVENIEKDGKYVLLSFWSASDGESRRIANDYTAWLNNNQTSNIGYVAVNFDKSEKLFKEIVKRDGLNEDMQFNVSGNVAHQIISDYHLDNGYGSLLISPSGQIIAHNPTTDELNRIAGK